MMSPDEHAIDVATMPLGNIIAGLKADLLLLDEAIAAAERLRDAARRTAQRPSTRQEE
jgi:hypothetical protein